MWYITFILKNLGRRPFRSVLTVTAIALAVGSFVTLVGISAGFERAFLQLYESAGIDLIVVRTGSTQRLTSTLPEPLGDRILEVPGVKEVLPGLVEVVSLDVVSTDLKKYTLYGVLVQGWVPETKVFDHHLTIKEGRSLLRADDRTAILGTTLAQNMGKKIGDHFDLIENETFTVVGIYQSTNVFENGAMVVPLRQLQRIQNEPGEVTGFSVILEKSGDVVPPVQLQRIKELQRSTDHPEEITGFSIIMDKSEDVAKVDQVDPAMTDLVSKEIKALDSRMEAMTAQEHAHSLPEIRLVKAMAWLTSAIAVIIGSFGIVNTMMMSVQERTREIGILRAVGWRKRRVVQMILLESVVLSLAGAIVGAGGGAILMTLLPNLRALSGLVDGYISPMLILQAFLIALGLGLVGGLLPAYNAARMLPTVALRYE
jgi:putative ABC transport system permease protein